jgi:hypothetical protein
MKKLLQISLLALCVLFSGTLLYGQNTIPFTTSWAESVGGPMNPDRVNDVKIQDSKLWVGGVVEGVDGSEDIYIDEYEREGGVYVQRRLLMGGFGNDSLEAFVIDNQGNFYLAGQINQSVNFNPNGTANVVGAGLGGAVSMAFIAKYDTSFNLQWIDTVYTDDVDVRTTALETDGDDVYWAISFADTLITPGGNAIAPSNRDALLVRYDLAQTVVWEQYYGSTAGGTGGFEIIEDIAIHPDSNYFVVAGTFDGNIDIFSGTSITAQGTRDGFMAKYNLTNHTQLDWQMGFPSINYGGVPAITIDKNADVLYATISSDVSGVINLNPLGAAVNLTPQYFPNTIYLACYNPNSGFLLDHAFFGDGTAANTTNPTIINDIDIDHVGLVYLGGAYPPTSTFNIGTGTILSNTSGDYGGFLAVFEMDSGTFEYKDATALDPLSGGFAEVLAVDAVNAGYVFAGGEYKSVGMECNPDNSFFSSVLINSNNNSVDGFVLESRVLRAPHPADLAALFELKAATGNWNTALQTAGNGDAWDTLAANNNFYNFYGIDTIYDPMGPFYRVSVLNLESLFNDYGVKLTGTLPNTLMDGDKLDYIHFLRLSNQDLTGGPTAVWDTMEHLIEINIGYNEFTYDDSLFVYLTENAPNIEWILADSYLSAAEVAMAHPFPNFPQNGPAGAFYANLRDIDIIDNGLSGTLPHPLQFSPVIEGYGFVYNNLTDIANPGATPIPNLFRIELDNNKFTDITDLAAILNNAPNLNIVWCTNMMDTTVVHNIPNLSIASPTIAEVLLGQNNINITSGLSLEDMMGADTEVFKFEDNKTLNFTGPTTSKPSLKTLNLAKNGMTQFMEDPAQLSLFMNCPALEKLDLSGNYFNGRLPNPLQLGQPFYNLANLRELHLDRGPSNPAIPESQRLRGDLNLFWLLGAQSQAALPKIEIIKVSNQNFKDVKILGLALSSFRMDSLKECRLDSNRFEFDDLYRVAQVGGMTQSTNAYFTHYLPPKAAIDPSTNAPDTLAFSYTGQKPDGVGGIRRRPENEPIWFDNAIGMPFNLTDTIYNEVFYFRSDTFDQAGLPFAQLPANAEVIGSISTDASGNINIQLNPALTVTPGTVKINPDTSTQFYNIVAITAVDSTHSDRYYTAVALNDSFPLTAVYTLPKLLLKGPCIDSLGQPILCQEIIVEFDRSMLLQSANPDSLKDAVREELGMYLIDSCTCGTVELWGTSDTAALELLAIGRGTRTSTTAASNRAELLSASPNYNLLASNSGGSNSTPALNPVGTTMPSPTLVAIIDAGIDYTHPDIEDRLWINPDEIPNNATDDDGNCVEDDLIGYNFMDKNNNPFDDHGHGTAIGGIIAGRSTNNISPNNSASDSLALVALKYTNADGEGTIFDATCAMYYASNYNSSNATDSSRIRVINASWGYYGEPSPILETAIQEAADNCGALIVTAAGNDGIDNDAVPHYPSGFPINNVLSVAAVSSANPEELATYSNYGTASVEIAAIGDVTSAQTGGGTAADAGTSYSTAQVSRAAGLLFNAYPDASFYAVKYALLKGADKLQSTDSTLLQSGGRLNLNNAMAILDSISNRSTCDNSLFVGTIQQEQTFLEEHDFRIYPNPFGDALQFEFLAENGAQEELDLQLIAVDGTVLISTQLAVGSSQYQLNTSDLAAGVYFLNIKTSSRQISRKIIKLSH